MFEIHPSVTQNSTELSFKFISLATWSQLPQYCSCCISFLLIIIKVLLSSAVEAKGNCSHYLPGQGTCEDCCSIDLVA